MKKLLFSILVLSVLLPGCAAASSLTISADPQTIGVGDTVSITVAAQADVPLNTFAGTLTYSPDMLTPLSVSDGNSIVNLWLTHPSAASSSVPFVGFTPGGFAGQGGKIFSVIFKAQKAGVAVFALRDIQVLRNDGKGTAEPVTAQPFALVIRTRAFGGFAAVKDTIPPEPFAPVIGSDPAVFGGKAYVAFSTTDKQSGVDHYDVAETRLPLFLSPLQWRRVDSPAVLEDQYLTSDVYVRAVDAAGNIRQEFLPRMHLFRPYEVIVLLILPALLFVFLLLVIALLGIEHFKDSRAIKHIEAELAHPHSTSHDPKPMVISELMHDDHNQEAV